jgi:hypothetical protein
MPAPRTFPNIYGVDFSGAKLAGHNTWIAHVEVSPRRLRLRALNNLEDLSSHAAREPALAWLSQTIADSTDALWAMDFPFAMPIEVMSKGATFDTQLAEIARWRKDAYSLGLRCVARSKRCADKLHIRRTTDTEARTPFDCYHYRIIYQTFHGMRDVLHPLRRHKRTAILPFDYKRLPRAHNALIESCPGSTLRRLRWPHNNYKQPTGGPLTPRRRRTRRQILDLLKQHIHIAPHHDRLIMRNPGADALDAVLAALAPALRWPHYDHRAIARHARYAREGHVYA